MRPKEGNSILTRLGLLEVSEQGDCRRCRGARICDPGRNLLPHWTTASITSWPANPGSTQRPGTTRVREAPRDPKQNHASELQDGAPSRRCREAEAETPQGGADVLPHVTALVRYHRYASDRDYRHEISYYKMSSRPLSFATTLVSSAHFDARPVSEVRATLDGDTLEFGRLYTHSLELS